jgi:hypothetical protein
LESYIRGDVEEVKITPANISRAEIAEIQTKLDKYLWCLRAKKFATKYFGGNIEKMICCIKDVDAAHKWTDLQTSITRVDWSRFYEDDDVSNHHQVAVCGGGECVLTHV